MVWGQAYYYHSMLPHTPNRYTLLQPESNQQQWRMGFWEWEAKKKKKKNVQKCLVPNNVMKIFLELIPRNIHVWLYGYIAIVNSMTVKYVAMVTQWHAPAVTTLL